MTAITTSANSTSRIDRQAPDPACDPASAADAISLEALTGPADLRGLDTVRLKSLAADIRAFLIKKVCATGGHLGVNLGVVELTIALHRVFDSPNDILLFDTGHQAYVHKILTGRAAGFDGLRQSGGLSGYPMRSESVHDWIENSHASTALSYADGIAKALHLQHRLPGGAGGHQNHNGHRGSGHGVNNRPGNGHHGTGHGRGRRVVAVIGDGALTGGLAWEGLNNLAAAPDRPLIVVLNDNGRSYAPTIGGIAHHLGKLRSRYRRKGALLPAMYPIADSTLFDELGLTYLGPIDGHDIAETERALRHAVTLGRTVVVHVVTHKGRGYAPAERDEADHMHGIGVLDPATGKPPRPHRPIAGSPPVGANDNTNANANANGNGNGKNGMSSGGGSWTSVFGDEIAKIGARRQDITAITAAMPHPVGLNAFAQRFPDRTFDTGIAEQQAVCSAAGMAMAGLHPVVCVYATFLNRAFDQVLMDVALHRLGVTFVLDRAGITGPDGPSHHGMWDTAILATVPGLRLAAPRDPARLRELLNEAVDIGDAPTVVRFPKASAGPAIDAVARMDGIDILHRSHRRPLDVLIIAAGVMAAPALDAAHHLDAAGIGVTVADPRWILPVNPALVHLAARHRVVLTVEDASRVGGVGTAVAQACGDADVATPVRNLGLPRAFVEHGDRAQLLADAGLTADHIAHTAYTAIHALQPATDSAPHSRRGGRGS